MISILSIPDALFQDAGLSDRPGPGALNALDNGMGIFSLRHLSLVAAVARDGAKLTGMVEPIVGPGANGLRSNRLHVAIGDRSESPWRVASSVESAIETNLELAHLSELDARMRYPLPDPVPPVAYHAGGACQTYFL